MDARTALMSPLQRRPTSPWSVVDRLEAPVEAVAFWAAMGLPVGYLALLAGGIEGRADLGLFLALLGLHGLVLVVGHDHQPRPRGRSVSDPG